MEKYILLGHGSGGLMTRQLIVDIFLRHFGDDTLQKLTDSAVISMNSHRLAFTTDAFVVKPIFFPGGDIGKLAVAGTVNDLAVSGATPLYLSAAFVIEEGLPVEDLETVVRSMAQEARKAGVRIVCGDTKVVDRGNADKMFITTAGVGTLEERFTDIGTGTGIRPGDRIMISGSVGDHGMAVMMARELLGFSSEVKSDCASLNHLIGKCLDRHPGIRFMRDPTRGGLAAVLCELAEMTGFGIEIDEPAIPVHDPVRGLCELLGFDPLYVANEGKVVMVADQTNADRILSTMRSDALGKEASVIGRIVDHHPGQTWMNTGPGGKRIVDMPAGEQLPRIC
ncbi:MAG: hydrogenase expression/formation protein HypE [Bacteroidales bacterium]|nr:hydrogenase expression/formation protein HypE [Bacteroidales bacterium]